MKKYIIIFLLFISVAIITPFTLVNARDDNGGWNRTFFEDRGDCYAPPGDCLDDIIVTP